MPINTWEAWADVHPASTRSRRVLRRRKAARARWSTHIPHPFSQFRGILAEPPAGGEGELCVDYFMHCNFLFLGYLFINHNFMQTGRPIADPPG